MNKRQTGTAYEERAAAYLESCGYQIVEKNFRIRSGEIDLIARDGRCLVFVEVKYRRDGRMGSPLAAVDWHKQRVIVQTAKYYLHRFGYGEDTLCRFDVIGIEGGELTHIQNAFEA